MLSRKCKVIAAAILTGVFMAGCAEQMTVRYLKGQKPALTLDDLSLKLQAADYVVLGEVHDNPIHHDLQLAVLQGLHGEGWLKQLTLEMMIPSQQAAADEMVARGISDPDKIYELLEWNDGWDWAFYGPIVIWAVSKGIPLKAGNLSRDELKIIRSQPVRIGEVILGEGGLNIHRERLRSAHCGNISKAMEERMLRVQVARDVRMANSMLAVPTGSALLAGNWHARKDIGVPRYLASLKPEASVISVGFLEQPAMADLSSVELFDIAWDTPGIQRQDYSDLCKSKSVK